MLWTVLDSMWIASSLTSFEIIWMSEAQGIHMNLSARNDFLWECGSKFQTFFSSGGKDSCYNMMQCVAEGHSIVALANLYPKEKDKGKNAQYLLLGLVDLRIIVPQFLIHLIHL